MWQNWLLVFHKLLNHWDFYLLALQGDDPKKAGKIHWVKVAWSKMPHKCQRTGWCETTEGQLTAQMNLCLPDRHKLAIRSTLSCSVQKCPPSLLWQMYSSTHSTEAVPRDYSCPVFTEFHGVVRLSSHECSLCASSRRKRRSFPPAARQHWCIQPCGKQQSTPSLSWQSGNAALHISRIFRMSTTTTLLWERTTFLCPLLCLITSVFGPERKFKCSTLSLSVCQSAHMCQWAALNLFICVAIVAQILVLPCSSIDCFPLEATKRLSCFCPLI